MIAKCSGGDSWGGPAHSDRNGTDMMQGGLERLQRRSHKPKEVGSTPTPATRPQRVEDSGPLRILSRLCRSVSASRCIEWSSGKNPNFPTSATRGTRHFSWGWGEAWPFPLNASSHMSLAVLAKTAKRSAVRKSLLVMVEIPSFIACAATRSGTQG